MTISFDAPFVELPKAIRPISLRKRLSKQTRRFDVVISCEYSYCIVLYIGVGVGVVQCNQVGSLDDCTVSRCSFHSFHSLTHITSLLLSLLHYTLSLLLNFSVATLVPIAN
jgi:hypothetical protein